MNRILRKLHRGQRGMTGLETAIILIAFVTVASVLAYSVLSAGIFSAERGKATVYSGLESVQATMEVQGSVLGLTNNGAATLTTGTSGTNEITYIADTPGESGNAITIEYVDPAVLSTPLSVSVAASAITVTLATDADVAITSTAADVVTAINSDPTASDLVDASSTDTGLMEAMGITNLTGGTATPSLQEVQFMVGLTVQGGEKVDMGSVVINYFDSAIHDEDVDWSSAISEGSTERGAVALMEEDEIFIVNVTIPAEAVLDVYDSFTIQVIPPTGATITLQRTLPGGLSPVMDLQ